MINKDLQVPYKIYNSLYVQAKDYRYICLWGGRGSSGKSWGIADFLLIQSLQRKIRVLCTVLA